MIDITGMLPAPVSSATWLQGMAPLISWVAPLLLVLGGVLIMPLVAGAIGSAIGPGIERRAAGRYDHGYEGGYLDAAEEHGRAEGYAAYADSVVSDYGDEEVE